MNALRVSTLAKEGALKVSKFTKFPALIDEEEMQDLLHTLKKEVGDFGIYQVHGIVPIEEAAISQDQFLERYSYYIRLLKEGKIPAIKDFVPLLSTIFSTSSDILYAIAVNEGKVIVKPSRPIIQLQVNQIRYSPQDGEFRNMIYGEGGISWGIQWAYPHLYQDAKTHEIKKIIISEEFPNTILFRALQKWMRFHTLPTPFTVDEKKVNVPLRLGKKCFPWINRHPQLLGQGIRVHKIQESD